MFRKRCPLISIIVPCFNAESCLERCLDGLFSSSYSNIEVVCIDDASDDATFSVLKKYSLVHKNMKLLHNEVNKGVGYSRNRALKECSGEYIMFCDADDLYSKDMVQKMYDKKKKKKVDLVVCDAKIYNEDCKKRDEFENYRNAFLMDDTLVGKMKVNELVVFKTTRVLWNKIFKKSIIDKFKIDFPCLNMGEDVAFTLKYLACIKKVFFLDERLYTYFRKDNSIIGKRFSGSIEITDDCVKAHQLVLDFMKKNKIKRNFPLFELCYANEMEYVINLMKKVLKTEIKPK